MVSPHTTASGPLSSSITSPREYQTEPFAGLSRCQLGSNWYFKGVGILSTRGRQWISDGAGQRVFLERFNIFACPVDAQPARSPWAWPERAISLPAEPVSRRLFTEFHGTKTSVMFPILDPDLFNGTFIRAYDAISPDLAKRASAEACLWAMLALAGCAEGSQQVTLLPRPEQCIEQVKRLLLCTADASSLDSLQAILLLVR